MIATQPGGVGEGRYEKRLPGLTTRQPPNMVSGRKCRLRETQAAPVRRAPPERTGPTSLLNHETSDHLLSLVEAHVPSGTTER